MIERNNKILGIKAKGWSVLVFIAIAVITPILIIMISKLPSTVLADDSFEYWATKEEQLKRTQSKLIDEMNSYMQQQTEEKLLLQDLIDEAQANKNNNRVEVSTANFH